MRRERARRPGAGGGSGLVSARTGLVVVSGAFMANMAFAAVPTPLYVIYQHRDHFSDSIVTVVFSAYALGVLASLFFAGHLSDRFGRRPLLCTALGTNLASALVFCFVPALSGLIGARIVCGVAAGLTTATASTYVAELNAATSPPGSRRRAEVLAAAANTGGIGLGPLCAGLLAAFVPDPLLVPYAAFAVVLGLAVAAVAACPETAPARHPRPPYRPQRIAVPAAGRPRFFAATAAGLAAFAVFAMFTSLSPTFLAGTLHAPSHALAGAVAFSAFAAGATAQVGLWRLDNQTLLRASVPVIGTGLGLVVAAMWTATLAPFVAGGVLAGAGAGMVFKGALAAAAAGAPAGARAEVLAGFFLGAYIGLSIPVIALGIATTYAPARAAIVGFAALVTGAIALSVRLLEHRPATGSA